MLSSSSSSSPNAPKRHTPPSDTPLSPSSSIASDSDLAVHTAEEGFELRTLPRREERAAADNERGRLLDGAESDEDPGAEEEVLYDAFSDEEIRRPRRGRHGRVGTGHFDYTPAEERKVIRKLDRYLVGSLAVLYMLRYGTLA